MSEMERALWVNHVQRQCILDCNGDIDAALAASEQILSMHPEPRANFNLVAPIVLDRTLKTTYPRDRANRFVDKHKIAEASRDEHKAVELGKELPEEQLVNLHQAMYHLRSGGTIHHPKEDPSHAIDMHGQPADPKADANRKREHADRALKAIRRKNPDHDAADISLKEAGATEEEMRRLARVRHRSSKHEELDETLHEVYEEVAESVHRRLDDIVHISSPMSLEDVFLSQQRAVGEKWRGTSGRWFTKRQDGKVVPTRAPGSEESDGSVKGAGRPDVRGDDIPRRRVGAAPQRPSDETPDRPRDDRGESTSPRADRDEKEAPPRPAAATAGDDRTVARRRAVATVSSGLGEYESYFRENGQKDAADWIASLKNHVAEVGAEAALGALEEDTRSPQKRIEKVQYKGTGYFKGDYAEDAKFLKKYLREVGVNLITGTKTSGKLRTVVSAPNQLDKKQIKAEDFAARESLFENKLEESKHLPGLETSEDIHKLVGHTVTQFTPEVISKLDSTYGKGKWIVKSYGDEAYAGYGVFFPQRVKEIQESSKRVLWDCNRQLKKLGWKLHRDPDSNEITGVESIRDGEIARFGSKELGALTNKRVQRLANVASTSAPQENGTHLPATPEDSLRQDYGITLVQSESGKVIGVTDDDGNYVKVGTKEWEELEEWDDVAGHTMERAISAAESGQSDDVRFMVQPAFAAVGVTEKDRALGNTWETSTEGRVHVVTRDGKATVVPYATLAGRADAFPTVFKNDDIRAMERAVQEAIDALPPEQRAGQVYAPDVMKTKDGWRVVELNAATEGGQSLWLEENPFVIDAFSSLIAGREPAHARFIRELINSSLPTPERKTSPARAEPERRAVKGGAGFSTDAQGHEHKGAGPGGGQFTSKGEGGAKKTSAGRASKTLLKIGKLKVTIGGSQPEVNEADISAKAVRRIYASKREHQKVVQKALEKMRVCPEPTEKELEANRAGLERLGAQQYRRNLVGNTTDRRNRRNKLLEEFGDGETCPCVYCGVMVGHGTMEQDKIYTTEQGGRYRVPNLIPACSDCNKRRGDMPFAEAMNKVTRYVGSET